MTFLSELKELIRLIFATSPKNIKELEILEMSCFPFSGYLAMSWCGKIVTRYPDAIDETTVRHETTHLLQAKQCGSWISYYFKYLIEWFKGNYYTIPFEVEAYANEHKLDYNIDYDPTLLKTKYTLKDRMKLFKECGSVYKWKEYIRTL